MRARLRRWGIAFASLVIVFITLAACLMSAGCGASGHKSANYFGIADGNQWLYEGAGDVGSLDLEIKVEKPDASLHLPADVYDVAISGGLGSFKVSEQGLFLQVTPTDVKLWGVQSQGSPPTFYNPPYIWLQEPIVVGADYHTAVQNSPTPALMEVTTASTETTPWGPMQGFTLEEKSGNGALGGVILGFVPYLGFTRINIPDTPDLVLKDASLK